MNLPRTLVNPYALTAILFCMTGTPPRSPGRPKTGRKPIVSFRPPEWLLNEFDELVEATGEKRTDALINAMEAWVKKKRRDKPATPDDCPSDAG